MPIWIFTRLTLNEALRNRLIPLAFGLTMVYIGLLAWGSSKIAENLRDPLQSVISGAGLEQAAFFLGSLMLPLLAVFVPGHSVQQESENGLLQAILTKPVRRLDVVAGRWMGSAALLALWVALFSAGVILPIGWEIGYYPPHPIRAGELLLLQGLVVLSLRLLFGSFLGTLASGIVPLLIYGLGRIGGLVEAIGKALNISSMVNGGIATSLLIPTDVLWRGASYYLLPELTGLASQAAGPNNPFVSLAPLATPMLVWSVLYVVVIFFVGARVFSLRDI